MITFKLDYTAEQADIIYGIIFYNILDELKSDIFRYVNYHKLSFGCILTLEIYDISILENRLKDNLNKIGLLNYFEIKCSNSYYKAECTLNLKLEYRNKEELNKLIALCKLNGLRIDD